MMFLSFIIFEHFKPLCRYRLDAQTENCYLNSIPKRMTQHKWIDDTRECGSTNKNKDNTFMSNLMLTEPWRKTKVKQIIIRKWKTVLKRTIKAKFAYQVVGFVFFFYLSIVFLCIWETCSLQVDCTSADLHDFDLVTSSMTLQLSI
jgi:hypothetical protein